MESETLTNSYLPTISERIFAAAGPMLWVALSYIDPGKWAAAVEGGARFGFDFVLLVLAINFVATFCQYLSARVTISTGKDLSQICSEEYDDILCIFLGVQAEMSMIALDLTMVLGTAYGLNAVFGIDIFNCVLLTGFDAILFPLFTSLFENQKAKFLSVCLASFVLVSYIFGVLLSQPENPFPVSGMAIKLNGEIAYALMSLIGANIMPHNFYLHSYIVQNHGQQQQNVSKGGLCQDHFFATLCIFSCIFLLNYLLMNLAASVFYSTGLVLLTLQDALSLLDQVFRSSMASLALIVIMLICNHLIALKLYHGKQVVMQDLFKIDIPGWLHRVTIRLVSIIPALYCVWNSGSEGIFQLLIFTQVVVSLLLPSSVVPLFRIASSRSIMGPQKISPLLEFFTLVSFIGILGVKIIFIVEMLFGSSDWVSNLKWNISNSVPIPYFILLIAAFASLCLMLWLATTPLKSASSIESQTLMWEKRAYELESSSDGKQTEIGASQHHLENAVENQESEVPYEKSFSDSQNVSIPIPDIKLPEACVDSATVHHVSASQEIASEITVPSPSYSFSEVSATVGDLNVPQSLRINDVDSKSSNLESCFLVDKKLQIDDVQHDKDSGGTLEPEESTKDVSVSSQSLSADGPGSFRSLSGKSDDIGSGTGSLSRLAGLGRASRRQLTLILDGFWSQLFDFHGQATQEAKARKLDILLGIDSKIDPKSSLVHVKPESMKESTAHLALASGRGYDSLRTPTFYGSPKQQIGQSGINSPLGVPHGSPMWSPHVQSLDTYAQNSSHNALDYGERRYSSVHIPASSDGYDQQPATIHGYDLASYLGRIAKGKDSDYRGDKYESLMQPSSQSVKSNPKDLFSLPIGQKQVGQRAFTPPGFHNVTISRNSLSKFEKPLPDLSSPEHANFVNPADVKKFYSLPDISGLYTPLRDSPLASSRSQWDNSTGFGQSTSRLAREQTCLGVSPMGGTALGLTEYFPSKVRIDAFPLQITPNSGAGSLWSKQPHEKFGMIDKHPLNTQENASIVELEPKFLQSFRSCVMQLLKLEGFDWLFRQNEGIDEDLIDRVAAREKVLIEVETRALERKLGSAMKNDDAEHMKFMSVPNCGEGCVWRADIVVSFGVWCIHRILELSLMESRPELWGKYTYVLNRLQGIIDLAFAKPRSPMVPCFCLEIPPGYERKLSQPVAIGNIPPPAKMARGKFTTATMLLDMVKDVEIAISCRKGRTGTAAGDVAFPKGKENLASVLKRYKRRLTNKPVGSPEPGLGLRMVPLSPPLGS